SVVVLKSELHLNTDWQPLPGGQATLPIKDLYTQLIGEVKPEFVLSTGTAGGLSCQMSLGDVVVARAAHFHCQREFKNAPFKEAVFRSDWTIPMGQRAKAHQLMQAFAGRLTGAGTPPDARCGCSPNTFPANI